MLIETNKNKDIIATILKMISAIKYKIRSLLYSSFPINGSFK